MSKLLFRLRDVPADEAAEIKDLLLANDIEFYETSAGNWGVSMPALWLSNEDQMVQAKMLLEEYQQDRTARVRANYEEQRERGELPTTLGRFRQSPLPFSVYCLLIVLVVFFSVRFFVTL